MARERQKWLTVRVSADEYARIAAAARAAGTDRSGLVRQRLADVLATTPATPAPPSSARPATQTGG